MLLPILLDSQLVAGDVRRRPPDSGSRDTDDRMAAEVMSILAGPRQARSHAARGR